MRKPTRILRANGVTQEQLAKRVGQSVQYVSMQLNGRRPLTSPLIFALREVLPLELADQVQNSRGDE